MGEAKTIKRVSTARASAQNVRLGMRLAAVIELPTGDVKRIAGLRAVNKATSFVITCVQDELSRVSSVDVANVSTGFLGVSGEAEFPGAEFPGELLGEVTKDVTKLLQKALAAPMLEVVSLPPKQYKLVLRRFADRATAEQWVLEKLGVRRLDKGEKSLEQLRDAVRDFASALPTEYASRRSALGNAADVVRREIAAALEPELNAYAAAQPQGTYEDKKTLAKWINGELRRFGLAIKAPKTGHPCLIVGTTGNKPAVGRFVLDFTDSQGKRQHPASFAELPHLELTLDDLTRAPYGERIGRIQTNQK